MRAKYRVADRKYWKIKGRKVVEVNFDDKDMIIISFHKWNLINCEKMGKSILKKDFDNAFKKALNQIKKQ